VVNEHTVEAIAVELAKARASKEPLPLITARYPDLTVEDAYAVQGRWTAEMLAAGRTVVGHKIGLTSKVMQAATGIDEPDYGVILDDAIHENGATIRHDSYANVRIEVELGFVLGDDLDPNRASLLEVLDRTSYVVPALEILESRIELAGRTIIDTISDNAALGGVVVGGRPVRVDDVDLRWVAALLYRNETIEESGVAAAVLGHPATGVAWLARKLGQHGTVLRAGELVLAGSFTRPMCVEKGDTVHADYGPLGAVTCRFI
jgi:2-oxo-hept-3-ene-1,7-dioate hydratase